METIRNYATFDADFPEEDVAEVDDGSEIPVGRPVAEYLRAELARRGMTVTAVYQHSFYGWAFDVELGPVTVWCMLQFPDPWLLITDVPGRFFDRLLRRSPDEKHRTVLDVLGSVLADEPFHGAEWTTQADYDKPSRGARGKRE